MSYNDKEYVRDGTIDEDKSDMSFDVGQVYEQVNYVPCRPTQFYLVYLLFSYLL